MALQALKQMEVRKYHSVVNVKENSKSISFDIKNCAVCLDKLVDGQVRVGRSYQKIIAFLV